MRIISIDLTVVRSHRERLPALRDALRRDHEAMRLKIDSALQRAESLTINAEDQLRSLCEEHDEDSSVSESEIENAYSELEMCKRQEAEVRALAALAKAKMERIQQEFDLHILAARRELDSAISDFEAFDAVPVPTADDNTNINPSEKFGGSANASATVNLPQLPRGYVWIPLNELHWDEVPHDLQFKKADWNDIEVMMRNFMNVVVPMLSHPRGVTRDQLYALDVMNGVSNSSNQRSSLAFAWDCLIGGTDTIAVAAPSPLTGSKYGWQSGRHRALVAKSLGWTHIPAKMV